MSTVNRLYAERKGFSRQVIENALKIFEDYKLEEKEISVFYLPNQCIAFEWTCIHGEVNVEIGRDQYSLYITHPGMDNKTILSRMGIFY